MSEKKFNVEVCLVQASTTNVWNPEILSILLLPLFSQKDYV